MRWRLADIDREATLRLRALPHAEAADRWLVAFSSGAEHAIPWVVLGMAGAVVDSRRRRDWGRAAVAVAVTEASCQAIKSVLRRPRPSFPGLPSLAGTPSPYSFPSAHTASAVCAARIYADLLPGGWTLMPIAVASALSRPYLGMHYVSDVVAGAAIGWAVGALGD